MLVSFGRQAVLFDKSLELLILCSQVRLKEYGADLIEVADNGSGIAPSDYHAVTQKYHTSKLQEFTDLQASHTDSCSQGVGYSCGNEDYTCAIHHGEVIELDVFHGLASIVAKPFNAGTAGGRYARCLAGSSVGLV